VAGARVRRRVELAEVAARLAARGRMPNLVELIEDPESLGEPLLSDEERAVYVRSFTRTGFTGAINWYRNMDRNWETTPQLDGARITVPSLMITAEHDPVLRPEMAEGMRELVPDLEIVMLPGCGHWTQHERPAELNTLMLDWLARRFASN